jgi:hypothetical protein
VPAILGLLAALAAGCGETEESGRLGETLSAKGLEATVERVDASVRAPNSDVTGLSQPSPGTKLIGAQVRVCSDHGGAIGPFAFGIQTSAGDTGRLKHPQTNYRKSFETVRSGCGGGWVVFEIPSKSRPESITFGFQDTGSAFEQQDQVDAKFSWAVG